MTKRELIEALAAAPDDAIVFVETYDGDDIPLPSGSVALGFWYEDGMPGRRYQVFTTDPTYDPGPPEEGDSSPIRGRGVTIRLR